MPRPPPAPYFSPYRAPYCSLTLNPPPPVPQVLLANRVAQMRARAAQRAHAELAAAWFELAEEAARQRKEFVRQVRRGQARTLAWGFRAWVAELAFMRASYARAETVQVRSPPPPPVLRGPAMPPPPS